MVNRQAQPSKSRIRMLVFEIRRIIKRNDLYNISFIIAKTYNYENINPFAVYLTLLNTKNSNYIFLVDFTQNKLKQAR